MSRIDKNFKQDTSNNLGNFFILRLLFDFEIQMRNSLGIFIVIAISAVISVGILASIPVLPEVNTVFHVTLADPKLYEDGIYSNTFKIKKGAYVFRFVPSGDSPRTLTILLNGENFHFFEDFVLKGMLHERGISEFFTWEYEGENRIKVTEDTELEITIDPHQNIMGPVSIELIEE